MLSLLPKEKFIFGGISQLVVSQLFSAQIKGVAKCPWEKKLTVQRLCLKANKRGAGYWLAKGGLYYSTFSDLGG